MLSSQQAIAPQSLLSFRPPRLIASGSRPRGSGRVPYGRDKDSTPAISHIQSHLAVGTMRWPPITVLLGQNSTVLNSMIQHTEMGLSMVKRI